MKNKQFTREEVEKKQAQAIRLAENIGDSDLEDALRSESLEEYAEKKGIEIVKDNPAIPHSRRFHRLRGWRKEVTDRRLRQRAVESRPPGRHCFWCGATMRIMVAHIDGNESNGHRFNLGLTCRSCNAKVAYVMKHLGLGRRTRQYNPSGQGAQTLGQWLAAVMSMRGESDQMPVADAVALIHATPQVYRSEFAREIWRLRKKRGTDLKYGF
jgi:hypothetical protein